MLLFSSCGNKWSIAMVGEEYQTVADIVWYYEEKYKDEGEFDYLIKEDTIGYQFTLEDQPLDVLYLFTDGICTYQELNVYCSPCADAIVDAILSDKRYAFKPLDPVNYISKKDSSIVMRLKEDASANSCSKIKINKILYNRFKT